MISHLTCPAVFVAVSLAFMASAGATDLLVDFNSTNQDNGPNHQSGYQPYNARHEVAADFLAARSYSAFDTTVSLLVTWPDTTNNRVQQMIDRGASNDANWTGQKLNLLTDWIGIDTRTAEGGRGNHDGTNGLPTRMVFRFAGVPAGTYSYRSYHHDTEHLHTEFRVEISTDGGSSYTLLGGPFRMTDSTPGGTPASAQTYGGGGNQDPATLPSTVNFNFIAQAGQDVLVRYTPLSSAAGVHLQLFGVNGLEMSQISPPDSPEDIALSSLSVSRFAPEGTVVGGLTTVDPTPGDTFTYTLVSGAGGDQNADFAIDGANLVVDRQLSEYPIGENLSVRIRSTDANGGWTEKSFTLQVINDADADGLEDSWELLYFLNLSAEPGDDPDEDDLTHLEEQTAGTHPLLPDTDGDGLSDGDEVKLHLTDPLVVDTDGDGLTDHEEIAIHLTNPLQADTDGDGYDDALELSLSTDPTAAQSFPAFQIPPRINEFLAVNDTGLRDGDGARVDWIELHNPNPQPLDLAGYRLTDSALVPAKWVFPAVSIPANGYLVVFASGSGIPDAGGNLHTNFSLASGGEYLALSRPDGTLVQSFAPAFPAQHGDVSYGRHPVSGAQRYFSPPTPGAANAEGFAGVVAAPQFSVPRGFHDDPFSLQLTCPTPLAQIRYTVDGSKPSPTRGLVHDGTPLNVTTTAKIRALAWRDGWLSRPVQTHSYVFVDHVAQQPANPPGWPANWGYDAEVGQIIPSDYAMDPRVVGSTLPGYGIRDALLDIPSVSINLPMSEFIEPPQGIYASPLVRRETECSVEYLPVDGSAGFQTDCKVEVHGNSSRRPFRMQKHSLRLTFSSQVGPPKLDYPLFPGSPVDEFNKLVLRACFSDSWALASWDAARYRPNDSQYFRDVWMKRSFGAMGQPMSYGRFVHLYVNGLYFGLHDLTERLEDDHFAEHHGGKPEDWEVNGDFSTGGARWSQMMAIANSSAISTPAGYAAILPYLDVENFADYMLLHFYADSEDWPHHNGYAAVNPVSGDGRYRFWVWDQEIALDKFTWNRYNRNDGINTPGTLFQRLRLNPEFRLLFADRVKKHLFGDGAISLDGSCARYLAIASWIDKAIVAESARWGDVSATTPYGSTVQQPNPLNNVEHDAYPPAPNFGQPGGAYFTREGSWVIERDHVVNYHIPIIHSTTDSRGLIQELRANGLYPALDAPTFAQHGGILAPGQMVEITAPLGVIHVTLDGSDPRDATSGDPAATSAPYTTAFPIATATTVKARARLEDGAWSALLAADFFLEEPVADFLPGTTAGWNVDANWTSTTFPTGPGKRARIYAPASGDRNVDISGAVTIGQIHFDHGASPFRNRVREQAGSHLLTFQSTSGDARVQVTGTGTGWAEFELASECVLASPLVIEVDHTAGNPELGALRLRSVWSGAGGLTKTGPGMASLTGAGKIYTGPTVIDHGVLAITEPSTMTESSSITVNPGGQLRLTSGGSLAVPRVHSFGGPLILNSTGRSGVGTGSGMGVLGAVRYDPGTGESRAIITNAIQLTGPSAIHVNGSGNQLELSGPLSGSHGWSKSGAGLLRVTADSPDYEGAVTVENGTLDLAARLASGIEITAGATLTGHGRCAALSGGGRVVLDGTVLRADTLAGVEAAFVFHSVGTPDFVTPAAAGNGTLVVGSMPDPLSGITVYLDAPDFQPGDRFRGGLALPAGSDWSALLPTAIAFVPDPAGSHEFDGRMWSPAAGAMFTRVPLIADLGDGPVPIEIVELRVDGAPIGFAQWQAANFSPAELANPAVSGENAAPQGDGVPNLLRYALRASAAGSVEMPTFTKSDAAFTFRFRYDPALYDVVYQVEATGDLADWSEAVVLFDSSLTTAPPPPDGWQEVTDPAPPPGRRFYRLKIIRPIP